MPPSESKRGILESTSKRVRMIFSVMASPNRIDILRILNNKGPLTYSELKSLAGFKSKKESGKFAYHLRKLLKQSLVGLNKSERRYTITNLGKLVLNLARQIEEKSIVESGKMYVRTSHQTLEEFNSHKIIQSLVREANLSLEQATKITEEVENKIYKLSTSYLTSRLIRDCVNNILVEHGLEDQMNKLIRVGIPIFDLDRTLNNSNNSLRNGINDLIIDISNNVLSDYFVNSFQKDILDMHYNGEIHLDTLGHWGIGPDTIFIDIEQVKSNLNLKGRFLFLPRISDQNNLNLVLPIIISILQREVSKEIVIENMDKIFRDYQMDKISDYFSLSLISSSISMQYMSPPFVTLVISGKEGNELLIQMLKGYSSYIQQVALPNFGLFINHAKSLSDDVLSLIAKIVKLGGKIILSQDAILSSRGIRKLNDTLLPNIVLNSLTINLPRLAYQSNKDETYFRTKLALLMKPSISTLLMKKEILSRNIQHNILPTISDVLGFPEVGSTSIIVNIAGLNESIYDILGYSREDGFDTVKKVIKTANDVLLGLSQTNTEKFGVSMINDGSSTRFVVLDSDKFGKLTHDFQSYSQGVVITRGLLENDNSISDNLMQLDRLVSGGLYIRLDITGTSEQELINLLKIAIPAIPYFVLFEKHFICSICGRRDIKNNICLSCGSSNVNEIN
ncbi:MAG TPA: anaerobic ribonucleoside-triphosphate reductase [Candidatus Nitrosocosmicus sp.]|nr:anaerobic ribonucleoside-triphosphate reductase [Candidatus Nitrosocosmicus sp.]